MRTLIVFALVGFGAQLVDGALGMAYGVTSTSLLPVAGVNPATAGASVHLAEVGTTLAAGRDRPHVTARRGAPLPARSRRRLRRRLGWRGLGVEHLDAEPDQEFLVAPPASAGSAPAWRSTS
ncbi:hypothetical protein [Pseudonocardia xishanensis]|uniref:Sulfite exporter TauE/SafE n=1 Tax=Pseudonocardia xishanensis TaxID=630995 RepID=A0ABP8S3P8_9PSEU